MWLKPPNEAVKPRQMKLTVTSPTRDIGLILSAISERLAGGLKGQSVLGCVTYDLG